MHWKGVISSLLPKPWFVVIWVKCIHHYQSCWLLVVYFSLSNEKNPQSWAPKQSVQTFGFKIVVKTTHLGTVGVIFQNLGSVNFFQTHLHNSMQNVRKTFTIGRTHCRPFMHATITGIRVPFSKMVINFLNFLYTLHFCPSLKKVPPCPYVLECALVGSQ